MEKSQKRQRERPKPELEGTGIEKVAPPFFRACPKKLGGTAKGDDFKPIVSWRTRIEAGIRTIGGRACRGRLCAE